MSTALECRRNWAAYVIGGLDREEVLACRRHLARCQSCIEEVELLASVADALPLMTAHTQQLAITRARTVHDVRRDALKDRAPAVLEPQAQPKKRALKALLGRPVPTPALAGFGALLVAAVITLVLSFHSANARLVHGQANWSPGGMLVQLTGSRGVLLVDGMPPAPAGDTYEVWIRHGHGRLAPSGATFDVDAAGQAEVTLPGQLGSGDTVVVAPRVLAGTKATREPIVATAHL